ncbi:MAG: NACHT domain-containing protein, partial [Opitutaceae bacterium]|nr:NACHT domain-containing protein [Opitutaceae bacterium]
ANGYYYASALNRFLRIKSRGLRRVPSLLKGILDSADQLLLLTGEPGSGKSVAMRHLALELADRAIRSRAENCLIPLYVNLRELDFPTTKDLTPEFLRDFVIANVRRGDGDLAQVIRERWNDYRDQGRWYFLFDSFDEIPSILHAPHGSRMIVECANALQAFQNANGPCRGIIASRLRDRHFKYPHGFVSASRAARYSSASSRLERHIVSVGRRLMQKAGRSGLPKRAQRRSGRSCTQGMPAGLPWGMPGIGEVIEGAMQQAAQFGRQSMAELLA